MTEPVTRPPSGRELSDPAAPQVRFNERLLLRRIITRLCSAAASKDPLFDEQLHEIERAMHRPSAEGELEHLLINLTDAVGHANEVMPSELEATASPVAPDAVTDGSYRRVFEYLLDRIEISPHLLSQLTGAKAEISGSRSEMEIMQAAGRIVALINQQLAGMQREQIRMAAILQNVTAGLDQIARLLTEETASRDAASEDGADLDRRLQAEVDAIDASIRTAVDLSQVQEHVLSRIDLISEHLHGFRQREMSRLSEYKDRVDLMKSRVDELEHEAEALQESVYREQVKASTDMLTGIPNRLAFHQRMNEEYLHWKASGVPLCVAMWDIDAFKSINDTYGHAAGDKALRIFAQHLARSLRKTDFVARYGGEEFVTILRGIEWQNAMNQVERIRQSLSSLGLHFERKDVKLTASCGLAVFNVGDAVDEVLQRADEALYRAKRAGRDRCFLGQ
ncbi:MAG: diguanylate cyclase [Nevskia sp.]|nr:diguanylate cyclase [Nevskia sp.]